MKSNVIIPLILSVCLFAGAGVLIGVSHPFANITAQNAVVLNNTQLQPKEETSTAVIEAAPTQVHNYDTPYGDKDFDDNALKLAENWFDQLFNVGFRSMTASADAYVSSASEIFACGEAVFGIYKFSNSQFPQFIANMVVEDSLELSAEFTPYAQFEQDDYFVINGDLKVTAYAGDLEMFAKVFQIDDMQLNQQYDIPISCAVNPNINEIRSLTYGYQETP